MSQSKCPLQIRREVDVIPTKVGLLLFCVEGGQRTKTLRKMAFLVDINYPLEDFFVQDDEILGECEDCGEMTEGWVLDQCQYGFCGRFSCRQCSFSCVRCRNYNPRSVTLCGRHTNIAFPECNECNRRFCDECTTVRVKKVIFCQSILLEHWCFWSKQLIVIGFCLRFRNLYYIIFSGKYLITVLTSRT